MKRKGTTYKHTKHKHAKIEVGDSKQTDFYPQFKSLHWDNECNFSIRLKEDITDSTFSEKDGVIEWKDKTAKKTARFYNKQADDEFGGFEFEVEFAEKPASILEFSIQSKGLKFLKQGELTAEEVKRGHKRPEHIVNSIAVYHDSKKDGVYKTGKAFHIPRLFLIDKKGNKAWCDQDIIGDTYRVTMPQDFLDNAKYPIILDPTFGYTSVGGSLGYGARDKSYSGSKFTAVDGTITMISCYAELLSSRLMSSAIYDDNSGTPENVLDQSTQDSTGSGGTQWWDTTVNYVHSSGAIPLWLFFRSSWDFYIAYDSGDTGQSAYKDDAAASSMVYEDPLTGTDLYIWDDVLSIYATYTAASSAENQLGFQYLGGTYLGAGILEVTAAAYGLSCTQGSYSLSGQAVALKRQLKLTCSQGSYSLSGQTANLKRSYNLSLTQGSYSLSGQAVTLSRSLTLPLSQGSYTLTGQSVNLSRTLKLALSQGSYSLTGQDVNLVTGYFLSLTQGSYTLSGQSAALKRSLKLTLSQGSYTLSGQDIAFNTDITLPLSQGSYSLTGQSVGLKRALKLTLSSGSYNLSGQSIGLNYTRTLSLSSGSYSLSGQSAAFTRSLKLSLVYGTYTLTGNDVTLTSSAVVLPYSTFIIYAQTIAQSNFIIYEKTIPQSNFTM